MMKKFFGKLLKVLIFIMVIFIGFPIGFTVGKMLSQGSEGGITFLELIVALIIAWHFNIIVHESGHLVFGLLTGYGFSSFRIWSLMLVKQEGKIRLRRFKLMGTSGQCLMTPPERGDSKASVILYNLGGVIFNIFLALICLTIGAVIPDVPLLTDILMFSGIISVFNAIINGIPMNVGGIIANDGMNALHLSKNPDAADAFRKQLLMNAAQTEGARISEMPDEWFTLPEGADMQNVHCASVAVFAASRPLDRGDTVAAEQEISSLLHSGYNIIGLHKNLLTCDLIYCRLINDPTADVTPLLTQELKNLMRSMKTYPSVIRTQFAIALFVDKDEKKAEDILASFDKQTKNFPYRQEIDVERNLMLKILEKYKNEA